MVLIPARGGSKGVLRKALRMLGDMPLIAYTIKDALRIPGVDKVFVSTDDPEIREVSVGWGAEVPFLRPLELAQDDSRIEDARSYSLAWYLENECFVPDIEIIMSPTHPFRRRNLVGDALSMGIDDKMIFNIGSIAPANINILNYRDAKEEGNGRLFSGGQLEKFSSVPLYQSAFSFNIVFNNRANLLNRRVPVILNEIEAIDIDQPLDLELARQVVKEGFYPFKQND